MSSATALRLTIERSLERRFPSALTPAPRAQRETAATGIAEVDAHLEGGLPVGALSELTGPASSGRTSLALAFVARRTAEGRACAWVDASDAFDPESAAASGVLLPQLLWVRCRNGAAPAPAPAAGAAKSLPDKARPATAVPELRYTGAAQSSGVFLKKTPPFTELKSAHELWNRSKARVWTHLDQTLRATDLLLQAGGFAALVLDLGNVAREQGNRIPLTTWFRFRQAADRARSSLVVLGRAPYAQSTSALVLACRSARAVTAGETALRGFQFQIERRRERFEPIAITRNSGKKPPVSTWTADASWSVGAARDTANASSEIDPIEERRA
jgi:recombination protein RecA